MNTALLLIQGQRTVYTYKWSSGEEDSFISTRIPGKYQLTITSDIGCETADTIELVLTSVGCECNILIPDAFGPNNNGYNDSFAPITSQTCPLFTFYTLSIYNRWGNKLFESSDPSLTWGGENAVPGLYLYSFSYEIDGVMNEKNGTIQLLR